MTKKGIVSTTDNENRKARVLFPESNSITPELPIALHISEVKVNDTVLVEFWGSSLAEGIITENLSLTTPESIPTKLSQLENDAGFITADQVPQIAVSTYIHQQISPAQVWIISHNLGRFPAVTIVDSAGSIVLGDIEYISVQRVQISFTAAFAGKAYLN
ncbi:hypothetical protein [Desulfosporosinus sp. OT]|uniref:hypothetical protein n=1 Tax=Desulfosporosinus sp. OT TaxID=913865 RepID=UPI000223A460|nr:hypothetical protein [Desulfosporosinus sp. OT]EGW39152.1 hypothetical protein DOT_2885 [Desulfosporosinus sp. OT]